MTTNEFVWPAYERVLRAANRSPRTIQSYEETFDLLVRFHNDAEILEMDEVDIQDFLVDQLGQHAAGTARLRFRNLRALFNWLVRAEYIDASPMVRLAEPKPTDRPPAVLDDDQLKALLVACSGKTYDDRRDSAIVRLWCEAGSARVSEMAQIDLEDLDMRRGLVRLHGKGNKIRLIPFGNKTGTALDAFILARRRHPLAAKINRLWLGARGTALTSSGLYQMLSRRGKAAGIGHIYPHQLRHTAAHNWKLHGGTDDDGMALFGWESSAMLQIYGRSARVERAQHASRRMSLGDRL